MNKSLGKIFKLSELKGWEKNPRGVRTEDFTRLKIQLQLGQYKPLICLEDGTVLGGNMRLKALQELDIKEVWCSIISFEKSGKKFKAIVNGEEGKKTFDTKEQGMLEYALSDNDRIGYYEEQALAELLSNIKIPLNLYKIDMSMPVDLQKITASFGPDERPDVDDLETRQLDIYLNADIKQIVLFFKSEDFESVINRLAKVRTDFNVPNNTEAVLKILEFYENNRKS